MRAARRATLVLAWAVVAAAVPALADEVDAAVAAARGASLRVVTEVEQLAVSSARSQAARQQLGHVSLAQLEGCTAAGEVVGRGPDVAAVFAAFRDSPTHRAVITDPRWTAMGSGLAQGGDGYLYVSVVFCLLAAPPRQPAPQPAPPPPSSQLAMPPPAGAARSTSIPAQPDPSVPPPAPACAAPTSSVTLLEARTFGSPLVSGVLAALSPPIRVILTGTAGGPVPCEE
jgi:hypothetical protein